MGSSLRWRLTTIVLSLVLAIGGALGVLRYANRADERALAGQVPVEVLVVTEAVAVGTPAADLTGVVAVRIVPTATLPEGAVTDLAELEGLVAAIDLVPDEVLLRARFVEPTALLPADLVPVPDGLQEVTFAVPVDLAVGGNLVPGDRVAIYGSFSKAATTTTEDGEEDVRDRVTALLLSDLLVTRVQFTEPVTAPGEGSDAGTVTAPRGTVLLTLAVDVADAERLTFVLQFGDVRVARLTPQSRLDGSVRRDLDNIFG